MATTDWTVNAAHYFLTDTTRVIAYEWSREAGGYGGGGENHHQLAHHGGDAEMLQGLAKIAST